MSSRRFSLVFAPQRRVFAAFFLYAFAIGGFYPRLAELQRSMGLSESELGIGLIGAAFGTLVSLTLAGRLVERVGHRRTLFALLPGAAAVLRAGRPCERDGDTVRVSAARGAVHRRRSKCW